MGPVRRLVTIPLLMTFAIATPSWARVVTIDRVLLKGDRVVVEMLGSDDEEDTRSEPSPDGRPTL